MDLIIKQIKNKEFDSLKKQVEEMSIPNIFLTCFIAEMDDLDAAKYFRNVPRVGDALCNAAIEFKADKIVNHLIKSGHVFKFRKNEMISYVENTKCFLYLLSLVGTSFECENFILENLVNKYGSRQSIAAYNAIKRE